MLTMTNTQTVATPKILFLDQYEVLNKDNLDIMSQRYPHYKFDRHSALSNIGTHYTSIILLADGYERATVRKLNALIDADLQTNLLIVSESNNPSELLPYLTSDVQGLMSLRYFMENMSFVMKQTEMGTTFLEPSYHKSLVLEIERIKLREQPIKKLVLQKESLNEMLTDNEQNVLQLLLEGKNNLQISQSLYLAPSTISTIISHLLKKIEANDRTDALVTAIRNGWVDAYR